MACCQAREADALSDSEFNCEPVCDRSAVINSVTGTAASDRRADCTVTPSETVRSAPEARDSDGPRARDSPGPRAAWTVR
eukprot:561734-Hanusia_phi.AAC.1